MEMNEEDLIKIVVGILAASISYILFLNDDYESEEKFEATKMKIDFSILVRTAILLYSVNHKWPLNMCLTITIIISAFILIMK